MPNPVEVPDESISGVFFVVPVLGVERGRLRALLNGVAYVDVPGRLPFSTSKVSPTRTFIASTLARVSS